MMENWNDGKLEEFGNSIIRQFDNGRMEGWKKGRMWQFDNSTHYSYPGDNGRMEYWSETYQVCKTVRFFESVNGRMEGWKVGRMENWKKGRMWQFDNSTPDSYRGDNGRMEGWSETYQVCKTCEVF